ncbi:MAG: hypothetical protein ACWA40_04905 [Planktomarina sp.]
MPDFAALHRFFEAWGETNPQTQSGEIANVMADTFTYADPRSGGRITDINDLCSYVAMFAANAPGWTARVEKTDESCGYVRTVVAFGGKGPDGTDMVQHGTYFAELDSAEKITTLVGFVGAGEI